MKTLTTIAAGFLALASVAFAAKQVIIENYCDPDFPIWFTWTPGSDHPAEPIALLSSGEAEIRTIVNKGDVATISNDSSLAAQLTLGSSIDPASSTMPTMLYWSVANNGADPLQGKHFNVTSNGTYTDICQNAVGYDDQVHACDIDNEPNVTLTVNLCRFNAVNVS